MNRTILSPALILKTWPIGDTHRGVRFLLPEKGLVDACGYGTAGRKNPLRGTLQVLTSGTVSLFHDKVRDRYRVESFEPVNFFENIKMNIDKFETISLWSEILIKTAKQTEESVQVFALLDTALGILDNPDFTNISRIKRLNAQFLWQYLVLSGFQTDFSRCGHCFRSLVPGEPVFWNREGDIHCSQCGESGESLLTPGGRIWLAKTAGQPLPETINIGLEESVLEGIIKLFCDMVEHLTGSVLKTAAGKGVC